jgi:hypothetical protein
VSRPDPTRSARLLLALCARAEPTSEQQHALREAVAQIHPSWWDRVVADAEQEGMAPLLREHLRRADAPVPDAVARTLTGLAVRHRRAHAARVEVLAEALTALRAAGVPSLLLKGAATSHLLYADPALRAMRDVDLLVRERDTTSAIRVLTETGFSPTSLPSASHHARPLSRGSIVVEVHHRLGLRHPRGLELSRQRFEDLEPASQRLSIGGIEAAAPGPADLLRHGYRHTFSVPMGWEWFRIVGVADIVAMVERWTDVIDWSALTALDPAVTGALPMIHALTPWSARVSSRLGLRLRRRPLGVGLHYYGWPRVRGAGGSSALSSAERALATLFPSEHWVRLRHGGGSGALGAARSWLGHWGELSRLALVAAGSRGEGMRVE